MAWVLTGLRGTYNEQTYSLRSIVGMDGMIMVNRSGDFVMPQVSRGHSAITRSTGRATRRRIAVSPAGR